MSHDRKAQQWVLVGGTPLSKTVWGIEEVNFPCGYMMPPGAFAKNETALERPSSNDVWLMGGFAFELAKGGTEISESVAKKCIAGYRPWLCLFRNCLLDELEQRRHTIEIWDRGVSIFYGLWRQSCQILGDIIPLSEFSDFSSARTVLFHSGNSTEGLGFNDYNKSAPEIIHFMSQFLTVSRGDIWVQGPLVATQLPSDVKQVMFQAGDLKFEVAIKE